MTEKNNMRIIMGFGVCLCFWLTLFLSGCSTDLGVNPESGSIPSANSVSIHTDGGRIVPETALKFIELPKIKGKDQIAGDETYVEEEIEAEKGGKIHLNYTVPGQEKGHVNSFLDIAANSIPSDIVASLSLPADNVMAEVDLIFGPDGTTFVIPAEFKMSIDDFDLSDIDDPGSIGFYYYQEDTGLWERLDAEIQVDLENGHIYARAFIDHFSRYALAVSR